MTSVRDTGAVLHQLNKDMPVKWKKLCIYGLALGHVYLELMFLLLLNCQYRG